jgi:hypothetical protein
MRLDALIGNQLLMAQSIFALADHIQGASGAYMAPVKFAELPKPPSAGMINCVSDSKVHSLGSVVSGGGTNTVLAWYAGTNWLVLAGVPPLAAAFQVVATNPAPTSSRTYVMMGLGVSFTPELPRVIVTIDGQITNSLNGGETDAQLMWGIGVAPVYGAAPPAGATVIGTPIRFVSTTGGGSFTPFSQSGLITGLTSQLTWFGLALKAVSGTGSVQDITLTAHELM